MSQLFAAVLSALPHIFCCFFSKGVPSSQLAKFQVVTCPLSIGGLMTSGLKPVDWIPPLKHSVKGFFMQKLRHRQPNPARQCACYAHKEQLKILSWNVASLRRTMWMPWSFLVSWGVFGVFAFLYFGSWSSLQPCCGPKNSRFAHNSWRSSFSVLVFFTAFVCCSRVLKMGVDGLGPLSLVDGPLFGYSHCQIDDEKRWRSRIIFGTPEWAAGHHISPGNKPVNKEHLEKGRTIIASSPGKDTEITHSVIESSNGMKHACADSLTCGQSNNIAKSSVLRLYSECSRNTSCRTSTLLSWNRKCSRFSTEIVSGNTVPRQLESMPQFAQLMAWTKKVNCSNFSKIAKNGWLVILRNVPIFSGQANVASCGHGTVRCKWQACSLGLLVKLLDHIWLELPRSGAKWCM